MAGVPPGFGSENTTPSPLAPPEGVVPYRVLPKGVTPATGFWPSVPVKDAKTVGAANRSRAVKDAGGERHAGVWPLPIGAAERRQDRGRAASHRQGKHFAIALFGRINVACASVECRAVQHTGGEGQVAPWVLPVRAVELGQDRGRSTGYR